MQKEVQPLTREQQRLVEENIALLFFVANKYQHIPREAYENLVSRLKYRLCKCAQTFDPGRGLKFSSLVVKSLQGECNNFFRDEIWVVRPPRRLREKSFSEVVDRTGDSPSEAEVHGENPETIQSCAMPVSLDVIMDRDQDGTGLALNGQDVEESIEDRVVAQYGDRVILREIFEALRPEERWILATRMKRLAMGRIQERFGISRSEVHQVLDELMRKVKRYKFAAEDGDPIPESTGSKALDRAIRHHFTPEIKMMARRQALASAA